MRAILSSGFTEKICWTSIWKSRWRQIEAFFSPSKRPHLKRSVLNSQKKGMFIAVFSLILFFLYFIDIILFYCSLTIPEGLIALLKTTKVKANHSPDESRAQLYKRLWCILWVSRYTLRKGHCFSIKVEEVLH